VAAGRSTRPLGIVTNPPPAIDCARVLHFAWVDSSVHYRGNSTLFVGGKLQGEVPCLAICKYRGEEEVLLFHCDNDWIAQGVSVHATSSEAMANAERMYEGISKKWVDSGTSEDDAERYLDKIFEGQACSFCAKRPDQVRQLYSSGRSRICDECVAKSHKLLTEEDLPPKRRDA
jgi:hypothetical protein